MAAAVVSGMFAGISGCAVSGRHAGRAPATREAPAPPLDAKARIPFDDLEALAVLPAGLEPAGGSMDGEARKHYEAGLDFYKLDQYSDAIEEFQAAVKADPRAFEPRLELGRSALQAGLFDQAHDALDVAVSLRPQDPRAHYLLGLLGYLRENDKAAQPQMRYALALFGQDGDCIKPLFYLTQILERQGYCQAAIDVASRFETVLAGHPKSQYEDARWQQVVASQAWKVPAARGNCLRKLNKLPQAVQAYDAALKLSPDRPEVQLQLAETLVDVGDTSRAVTLAEEVLAKDRHNSDALAILSATLAVEDRIPELQDRLLSMVRAKPSDLVLAQRATTVLLKFGRYDAALEALLLVYDAADDPAVLRGALLQVVFAYPDFDSAYQALARLLKQVGPDERASVLDLRDSMQVNPSLRIRIAGEDSLLAKADGDRNRLLALGALAGVTDRPVLSEGALRRILRDQPDDKMVAVMLAEQLVDQCRWQDVIAFVTPQIEKHKDQAAFYRLLGTAYDGLDDIKAAMNSFYEALRRDKRDVQSMWLASQINDRLGQSEPAVTIYQAIVTVRVDFWPAHLALVRAYLRMGQQSAALEHARKLKKLFPDVPAVDLCLLIAESGKSVLGADKIAPLLEHHGDDEILLRAAGESLLQEGKVPQAIAALNRLMALQPDDEDGRLLLATALSRQMNFDLAREVLRSLLYEHPNRHTWQLAEAELCLHAGKPAEAVPILRHMLEGPWDPEQRQLILDRLIFAWGCAGQYDAAIEHLRQGLQASPKDRALQTRLLGVLISADRRDQAMEYLRQWRRLEPDDPLLVRLEGQLLSTQGADQAAAALALKTSPTGSAPANASQERAPATSGKSARGRGRSSAAVGQTQTSRDIALLTALLSPADAVAWLTNRAWLGQTDLTAAALATVAGRQGRPLEAIELQRLTPSDDVEDLAQQVQWLLQAGQRAQAELVVMPQIEQKNPEMYARVRRLLPGFYKRFGLDRLSMTATAETFAANKDPGRAGEYANDLAYLWSENQMNLPQAEDLARIAVASDPTNAAYLDTLGWVSYKMGRFDEALAWLLRAVAVPTEGSDPVLMDHLGDAFWRVGKRDRALAAWRKSVELYQEELKTDSSRPDLPQGLDAVQRKVWSVESHNQPNVATSVAGKRKQPA